VAQRQEIQNFDDYLQKIKLVKLLLVWIRAVWQDKLLAVVILSKVALSHRRKYLKLLIALPIALL
jgi:hypothetical protein